MAFFLMLLVLHVAVETLGAGKRLNPNAIYDIIMDFIKTPGAILTQ